MHFEEVVLTFFVIFAGLPLGPAAGFFYIARNKLSLLFLMAPALS